MNYFKKTLIWLLCLVCLITLMACQREKPETIEVEVEVTRQVQVTRELEVEVTREVAVEVTREVMVQAPVKETPIFSAPQPGGEGLGDPLYPQLGNGGYDALHYGLELFVEMESNTISGTMTLSALATQDLSAFTLDFVGFEVSKILVDGVSAHLSREGAELTVLPLYPLNKGEHFMVSVTYSGVPGDAMYPEVVPPGVKVGWQHYGKGVAAFGEPSGAAGWFPVNEHPQDKATYYFRVTVAKPFVVAANGMLQETIDNGESRTYLWNAREPIASYLVTLNIGEFERQTEEGPNDLLIRNYFAEDLPTELRQAFVRQAEMIEYFSNLFGPYPFEVYGVVVHDRYEGWALECQTLSVFGRSNYSETIIVHELAHQWFGNSVTLANWQELWLNEGFADYAEVLWLEYAEGAAAMEEALLGRYSFMAPGEKMIWLSKEVMLGFASGLPDEQILPRQQVLIVLNGLNLPEDEQSALLNNLPEGGLPAEALPTLLDRLDVEEIRLSRRQFNQFLIGVEQKQFMNHDLALVPPGAPNPKQLFNPAIYERGALTLHALRLRVGDETFFDILRTYAARFRHRNASTTDFITLAEEISSQELKAFFDAWLYAEDIPDMPEMGWYREDFS